jgi:hypothetical protein
MKGRGQHLNSKAALKAASAERVRKRNARRPHLTAFHGPEHTAKMRAAKAAKKAEQAEANVTPPDAPVEDGADAAVAQMGEPRTAEVVGSTPTGRAIAPAQTPMLEKPTVETEGEWRSKLYERDYALLMTGRGRELNRLRAEESSTFSRRVPGRVDWLGLDKL